MYKSKSEPFPERPQTRADCYNMPRPCPFVGCRHHLYLDIRGNGRIVVNSEYQNAEDVDVALLEMPNTCALDLAEKNIGTGITLEEIGSIYGLSRERVRQIESKALWKLRRQKEVFTGYDDLVDLDDPEYVPLFSQSED